MTAAILFPVTPAAPRRVAVNDVDLAVTTYAGDGPPLLLIHGISSSGAVWWPVLDRLAARFTPITVDLRGHGASSRPASGYLYDDYAADLTGLLDALELERPLLIGHSLGGLVTLNWAMAHPDRAAAIVIEDSPLRSGQSFMPIFDDWLALNAMSVEEAAAAYAKERPDWSPEDCRARAELMVSTARAVFTELRADSLAHDGIDRVSRLAAIQSPVLFVHGDLNTGGMAHPQDLAQFAATVPRAEIVRMPGGGHSLHLEQPDAFLDIVLPFLTAAIHDERASHG